MLLLLGLALGIAPLLSAQSAPPLEEIHSRLTTPVSSVRCRVKVLLYRGRLERYNCLPPTPNKTDNSGRLNAWLDALRHGEGDPALLQVHESLLESSDILGKSPLEGPS